MRKSDKADVKLSKARKKLPTRRRFRVVKRYNTKKGGMKRKLRLVKEPRPKGYKTIKRRLVGVVGKGAGAVVTYGHKKVRQVEHENTGVEAAHKTEQFVERKVVNGAKSAARRIRAAPYKRVAKAQKKAIKAGSKYQYRKALHNNPAIKRKNLFQRAMMKQRIRKQRTALVKGDTRAGGKLASFIARVFGPRKKATVFLTGGALLFMLVSSCAAVLGSFFGGVAGTVAAHTYTAADSDMEGSSLLWTKWEYELFKEIESAEDDYPGYTDYVYESDGAIGHNPYQIIAFLSAMYDDFVYTDVSDALRDVFDEVYLLEFEDDGSTHTTRLTVQDFDDVVKPILEGADALEKYESYMKSLGGRQRYGNPLGFSWYGSITSLYGYRDNPISGAGTEVHRGLDISAASGHPIYSVHNGLVVQAVFGDSIYGHFVVVEDADGRKVKYAHCSALLVSVGDAVKKGDKIAEVGSTGRSTGAHLHIEIIENGEYFNPLFLLDYL